MPADLTEFSALMALVAQGDQQAAAQLFHLYEDSILAMIRSRLRRGIFRRLRCRLDEDDLSQNIWGALLTKPAKCRDLITPLDFLKYMAKMIHHQFEKASRKHLGAQKRDLRRVHHLSDPKVSFNANSVADPHLAPDHIAAFDDERDWWLSSLTAQERQVVSMMLDGFSHQEIAVEFECSERSIDRTIVDPENWTTS